VFLLLGPSEGGRSFRLRKPLQIANRFHVELHTDRLFGIGRRCFNGQDL
jgi:hypothetical protein